jgi:hypothetical protein
VLVIIGFEMDIFWVFKLFDDVFQDGSTRVLDLLVDDTGGFISFYSVFVIIDTSLGFKIDERLALTSGFIGFIILYRGWVTFLLDNIIATFIYFLGGGSWGFFDFFGGVWVIF